NGPANGGPSVTPATSGPTASVSASWNSGMTTFSRHNHGSRLLSSLRSDRSPASTSSTLACRYWSHQPATLPGSTSVSASSEVSTVRQAKRDAKSDAGSKLTARGPTSTSTVTSSPVPSSIGSTSGSAGSTAESPRGFGCTALAWIPAFSSCSTSRSAIDAYGSCSPGEATTRRNGSESAFCHSPATRRYPACRNSFSARAGFGLARPEGNVDL